jgi:hypothetical protein
MLSENMLLSRMKKAFFSVFLFWSFVSAQDFGYEYLMLTEYRSIGAAYNLQHFSSSSSNVLSDSNRIAFSSALPFIEFRQNNGRLAVGYQTFTDIKGKSRESFSVYGESQNDFPIGGSKQSKAAFSLPVVVSANYVRAQSPNTAIADFDIGSLGLGTGIKFKHFERSFGVQAFAVGSLYYASEGFGTDYGSQISLCAEVQLVLTELFYQGLLLGYRFETQRWNMNNSTLDYQRQYHGAFIGVIF